MRAHQIFTTREHFDQIKKENKKSLQTQIPPVKLTGEDIVLYAPIDAQWGKREDHLFFRIIGTISTTGLCLLALERLTAAEIDTLLTNTFRALDVKTKAFLVGAESFTPEEWMEKVNPFYPHKHLGLLLQFLPDYVRGQ